ncbi:hypothetical protein PAXRUDRAFT_21387 [Paxillus rubicundulus Ve08.2h10]|uniref:Uncharacterized protein n=1 Tax=Paxillus rubicundulus Ve08.2h10 TaxID=930991 RepID=A0A0D0CBX5_9AGAM|nr:hypothetical protein PAXRUDRAFT_21387 [Paxillus rubicundulus Ve08.2h10]
MVLGSDAGPAGQVANLEPSLDDPSQYDAPYMVDTTFFGARVKFYQNYHTLLTSQPHDMNGKFLADGTPPRLLHEKSSDNWGSYWNRLEFKLANFVYTRNQMPATQINVLLDIWAASLLEDLYKTINNTTLGNVQWDNFSIQYTSDHPPEVVTSWMNDVYEVYFQDP